MKTLLTSSRILVGILFIFSGLIKANDPLGLSYKMQEFFEVWNLHSLHSFTLPLSVIMIAFEIIAGVAVIIGWKMKFFSWLLLGLILFFTFLTGYALFSGKIKECGCFGDCIPLQAHHSFIKDIILLALISFLFYHRNRLVSTLSATTSIVIIFFTTVFSIAFQWYVLRYLPVVDCLPYKVGNNIPEKMKIPAGAIQDSTEITFVYKLGQKEVEFTSDNFPEDFNDSTYTFIRRYDKLIRKGNAQPSIKDFSLQTVYGNDTTQAVMMPGNTILILFVKDGFHTNRWPQYLSPIIKAGLAKGIEGFVSTNIAIEELRNIAPDAFTKMTPLRTDVTAIKTAARANPTLYLVKDGTILRKWGYADFSQALKFVSELPNTK